MENPSTGLLTRAFGMIRSLFTGGEQAEAPGDPTNGPESQPAETSAAPPRAAPTQPSLDLAGSAELDVDVDVDVDVDQQDEGDNVDVVVDETYDETYDPDAGGAHARDLDFDPEGSRLVGPRESMDSLGNSMAERMILHALGGEPDDLDDRDEFPDMHVVDTPDGAPLYRR